MKDRLFDPLQLSSTSSFHEQVDQDRAATGYLIRSLEGDPIPSPVAYLPRSYGPGGNVSSTPREVLTMAHVFLHEGVSMFRRCSVRAKKMTEDDQRQSSTYRQVNRMIVNIRPPGIQGLVGLPG
jgi:CubicO group peptidase (beta-lactamase class C family)